MVNLVSIWSLEHPVYPLRTLAIFRFDTGDDGFDTAIAVDFQSAYARRSAGCVFCPLQCRESLRLAAWGGIEKRKRLHLRSWMLSSP